MPPAGVLELQCSASTEPVLRAKVREELRIVHLIVWSASQLVQERVESLHHVVDRKTELFRDHPVGVSVRDELQDGNFDVR